MIVQSTDRSAALAIGLAKWAAPAAVVASLAAIVLARWAATRAGLDPLGVGAAFGTALAALWAVAAAGRGVVDPVALALHRPGVAARAPTMRRIPALARGAVAGLALGLALVALAVVGGWLGGAELARGTLRPAAPFLPWATVTVLVAAGQEGILRGVLFDRLRTSGGTILALALTSVAFALMHVPLYGWAVVPLDLAVGIALAGLRLWSRTLLAPIVAHAVADLATWWL